MSNLKSSTNKMMLFVFFIATTLSFRVLAQDSSAAASSPSEGGPTAVDSSKNPAEAVGSVKDIHANFKDEQAKIKAEADKVRAAEEEIKKKRQEIKEAKKAGASEESIK